MTYLPTYHTHPMPQCVQRNVCSRAPVAHVGDGSPESKTKQKPRSLTELRSGLWRLQPVSTGNPQHCPPKAITSTIIYTTSQRFFFLNFFLLLLFLGGGGGGGEIETVMGEGEGREIPNIASRKPSLPRSSTLLHNVSCF